ncbi:hypothetical protein CPAR01_08936 [Colletotrichum paranaense]|uniref:Uncharacterized protein n=5 Tax=Colletotrichum acutatum species complex TaxID=2707335 RepID=A0A9Q8SIY1_9PEZI|nr:uncharacterized protein CLUP02_03212 [Colletotrichum lupini]XP_060319061.1 uncharacterized protein CCOS01_02219 [Colletotrichum costaricense]XP_060347333.1 uncharacterized protein CPAR01_08936 [Colletotrichum paranaense]XP_060387397.1 uncharacterized protein CTAM01_01822 [Colletotrichum tamarilloi]KAI3534542.1 hypothetical protein CSPX01_12002 [Colletotrichum filicis]KAK1466819.1 hypothetical protein CMEL01_10812 [Colletotrichum melonis]KAK1509699.1 hypothetical protein CTAM01_01822 [Colle
MHRSALNPPHSMISLVVWGPDPGIAAASRHHLTPSCSCWLAFTTSIAAPACLRNKASHLQTSHPISAPTTNSLLHTVGRDINPTQIVFPFCFPAEEEFLPLTATPPS